MQSIVERRTSFSPSVRLFYPSQIIEIIYRSLDWYLTIWHKIQRSCDITDSSCTNFLQIIFFKTGLFRTYMTLYEIKLHLIFWNDALLNKSYVKKCVRPMHQQHKSIHIFWKIYQHFALATSFICFS